MDGSVSGSVEHKRVLSVSNSFVATVSFAEFENNMLVHGNVTGVVNGQVALRVRPHCCIPLRSVVSFSLSQGLRICFDEKSHF
jgi:hypothetical protein